MLTLDYRPARFSDLVGQGPARVILQSLVLTGGIPPAFLLRGPSGTGKTSAARVLAAALNCPNSKNGDCCGSCGVCLAVREGRSLAVHEIDAASHGGVDDIRSLRELVQYAVDRPWRVVILDECHALSRQAFNALLKVLEEPPARTVFMLLTTEADKIPKTVQSRAMPVDFGPVSHQAVLERLTHIRDAEKLDVSDELVAEIAELADGGLRGAIVLLDQVRLCKVSKVSQLHLLLGISTSPSNVVSKLLAGDLDGALAQVDDYFRHSANVTDFITGILRDLHHRYLSRQLPANALFAATKILWGARSLNPTSTRNSRAQVEALTTVLFMKLSPSQQPIPQVEDNTAAS